jgi:hypothetical protein
MADWVLGVARLISSARIEVREDGAALELEGAFARVGVHDEVRAEDVGGHEVGRELDAIERHVEHFAKRADEERLAEAGHAFEQHVPAAEQRDEGVLDDGGVADDDFADLGLERGVGVAEGLDLGFGAHGVIKPKLRKLRNFQESVLVNCKDQFQSRFEFLALLIFFIVGFDLPMCLRGRRV